MVGAPATIHLITDAQGRFAATDLEPGVYRVHFHAEGFVQYAYFDPMLVGRFSAQARPIRVTESSTGAAQLNLIPLQ